MNEIVQPLLIPDPMESKFSYALELVNWIWDQSLLTVEINTITLGKRHWDPGWYCCDRRTDPA